MEDKNNTNLEQIISVIKQPDGHLYIVKGTGREIVDSTISLIKSIFHNILKMDEIKDRAALIVRIWTDLAFDPIREIIDDNRIDMSSKLIALSAMTEIITRMHSYSSKEVEEEINDDEDSDDSSID